MSQVCYLITGRAETFANRGGPFEESVEITWPVRVCLGEAQVREELARLRAWLEAHEAELENGAVNERDPRVRPGTLYDFDRVPFDP